MKSEYEGFEEGKSELFPKTDKRKRQPHIFTLSERNSASLHIRLYECCTGNVAVVKNGYRTAQIQFLDDAVMCYPCQRQIKKGEILTILAGDICSIDDQPRERHFRKKPNPKFMIDDESIPF